MGHGDIRKQPLGNTRRQAKGDAALPGELFRTDIGKGFPLEGDVLVIGREYNCDIRIDQPCVSRVHAVISRENGRVVLEDLGGRNGTRVNRIFVGRTVLDDGDLIQIGRTALVFQLKRIGKD